MAKFVILLLLLPLLLRPHITLGQGIVSPDSTGGTPQAPLESTSPTCGTRLMIVGGVTLGTMVGIHIYQQNGWWRDNRAPFHFQEDLSYGMSVDKLGHFYGAAVLTTLTSKAFQWSCMPEAQSLWWGAGTALLFQTYVEIQDGFSAWGFDRVDFASDVAGALYPVAQHYVPFLRNFDIKFSYHPSDLINESGGAGFQGQQHILFDDYEGQTLWLGVYVNNLLPASVEPLWPDWLAIAVGYGVRDVASPNPYSIVMLALDYDMREIIPQSTPFLKTLGELLNYIHFPAPAVRISPNAVWYGLYF